MAGLFGNQVTQLGEPGGINPSAFATLGLSPQSFGTGITPGGGTNLLSSLSPASGSTLSPLSQGTGQSTGILQEIMILLEEMVQMLAGQASAAASGGAAGNLGGAGGLGAAGNAGGAGNVGGAGGNAIPVSLDSAVTPSAGGASGTGTGPLPQLTSAVGQVPQNAKAMYQYFTSQGLSPNAAAGIIGNIAQESGGNPESVGTGGNGLIGWTPPLAGAVTGNPQRDLQFQLPQVMKYIAQNGSVADINAHASSPTSAALYFMSQYERPAPATENAAHRVAAANATAQAFG